MEIVVRTTYIRGRPSLRLLSVDTVIEAERVLLLFFAIGKARRMKKIGLLNDVDSHPEIDTIAHK